MKKVLAFVLALVTILSLAACSSKKDDAQEPTTPATKLLAEFKQLSGSAEEIATKLSESDVIEFGPVVMPVEPGFLNGFSAEISGFDEGAVLAPMIGSIPFVSYVFTVSSDVDGFMQQLKDNADLRWNVCTQADEMVCEANGNTVFFAMSPNSFEE